MDDSAAYGIIDRCFFSFNTSKIFISCLNCFWRQVHYNSYLYSSISKVLFSQVSIRVISLSLVSCSLTVKCISVLFFFLFCSLSCLVFYVLPFLLLFILVWCFSVILNILGHYYLNIFTLPHSFFLLLFQQWYCHAVLECSLLFNFTFSSFHFRSFYWPNLSPLIFPSTISSQLTNLIHSSFCSSVFF